MKKFFLVIVTWIFFMYVTAISYATWLNVTGRVWNLNAAPSVISVTPNSGPELLSAWSLQNFVLKFRDNEKDNISYTITVQTNSGSVTPLSGTVSSWSFDVNNEATINLSYLAPVSAIWASNITVTLNDGPNITSYNIGLFIY